MPSNEEIGLARDALEYLLREYYQSATVREILSQDIPKAEGFNLMILLKGPAWSPNGEEGWSYRMAQWTSGPTFVPARDFNPPPPWTLNQVLEYKFRAGWKEKLADFRALDP